MVSSWATVSLGPPSLHSVACMVLPQGARLGQPPFRALAVTKPQRAFTGVHPSSLSLTWRGGVVPPRLGRSAQLRPPPLPATHVGSGNRSWTSHSAPRKLRIQHIFSDSLLAAKRP